MTTLEKAPNIKPNIGETPFTRFRQKALLGGWALLSLAGVAHGYNIGQEAEHSANEQHAADAVAFSDCVEVAEKLSGTKPDVRLVRLSHLSSEDLTACRLDDLKTLDVLDQHDYTSQTGARVNSAGDNPLIEIPSARRLEELSAQSMENSQDISQINIARSAAKYGALGFALGLVPLSVAGAIAAFREKAQ